MYHYKTNSFNMVNNDIKRAKAKLLKELLIYRKTS
uniref:Uncharacterized protein n=1 Tax=Nelumbo nucifera TaxID=4432 RepID=A0A822YQ63_NELNU|nr:TPA_asm: hypothetical protein HUJ06_012340 [Nelumbo nucifera]